MVFAGLGALTNFWARQTADVLYARETVERAQQLSTGLFAYVRENVRFPELSTPSDLKRALAPKYVSVDSTFLAPKTKRPLRANPYLSGKTLGEIENFANVVAVYEDDPLDSGSGGRRAVGLLSGNARMVAAEEWETMRRESHIP